MEKKKEKGLLKGNEGNRKQCVEVPKSHRFIHKLYCRDFLITGEEFQIRKGVRQGKKEERRVSFFFFKEKTIVLFASLLVPSNSHICASRGGRWKKTKKNKKRNTKTKQPQQEENTGRRCEEFIE